MEPPDKEALASADRGVTSIRVGLLFIVGTKSDRILDCKDDIAASVEGIESELAELRRTGQPRLYGAGVLPTVLRPLDPDAEAGIRNSLAVLMYCGQIFGGELGAKVERHARRIAELAGLRK